MGTVKGTPSGVKVGTKLVNTLAKANNLFATLTKGEVRLIRKVARKSGHGGLAGAKRAA